MIGAVSVIRDHEPRWKGMVGVGKGLPKKEIDFEHETIGGIGKGARVGLWVGGGEDETFDSDFRTFIQRFFVVTGFILTLE